MGHRMSPIVSSDRDLGGGGNKVNRTCEQRFIMCATLISKALRLARANEGLHSFIYHPTYGMSHSAFTPQPQSVAALWPVLITRPAEGRRLSWPRWLGEIRRWFAGSKTLTHPGVSRGGRNRTRDHRVASPTQ